MDLLVRSTTWEADGVLSLELVDPAGGDLPAWEPGAHVDVGVGSHERQYSLCGDPADRSRYRIGVLREAVSRGGSDWVHAVLRPGMQVPVSEPRNHFPLVEAPAYLFVGGGIGITPLLPMIAAVDAQGAAWRLVYGGRRAASMAFTGELAGYGDRVTLWPEEERGLIDLDGVLAAAPDAVVYCCGPEPLLAAVEARRPCRVERFAPKPMEASGPEAAFEVELKASGVTLTVPADRSILAVLEEYGIDVLSSCQEGTCGTCETVVLDGLPEHRDSILDDEDRESGEMMMICVVPVEVTEAGAAAVKALCFLDVDGVVVLDRPEVPVTAHSVSAFGKWRREVLVPDVAPHLLARLDATFECVWIGGWSHNAHPALRGVLDLPATPWPWIGVQFHKLDAIRAHAAGRPWVWIDDGIDDLGPLPDPPDGVLVRVDPRRGIADVDPDALVTA